MKGKIFTILFSMLLLVAFAAPPTIIPDPPLQKESFSIVASVDYVAPFIYDNVVDFQTMSTDVSIIPKDANNIGISSDIIAAWMKDRDPGHSTNLVLSITKSQDNQGNLSGINNNKNIISISNPYDPGWCK